MNGSFSAFGAERQLQRLRRGRQEVDQVQQQTLAGGIVRVAHEVGPHERDGAASHGILRDGACDAPLPGVRHAHQARVVGQVHAVLPLVDRAELGVEARLRGEALEELRAIGDERAALFGRADREHAAVGEAEAFRDRGAPLIRGIQRDHVHALRRRAEHRVDQAFVVVRRAARDDHHVWQITLRRRLRVEFRDVQSPRLVHGQRLDAPQTHLLRLVLRQHRGVDGRRRATWFAHQLEEPLERLHARDLVRGEIRLNVRREILLRREQRRGAQCTCDQKNLLHLQPLFLISLSASIAENCGRMKQLRRFFSSEGSLNLQFTGSHSIVRPGLLSAW